MKRKRVIILSVLAAVLIVCAIGVYSIVSSLKQEVNQIETMTIEDVDLSKVPDGTYTGSCTTTLVSAKVSVTVKGHEITQIELLEHNNGKGSAAETIPDEVVRTGSLQVDAVSGATHSSKVILKAIQNALQNAIS